MNREKMEAMTSHPRPDWVLGCGQPVWHHDPFYCGPECEEWVDYDEDDAGSQP